MSANLTAANVAVALDLRDMDYSAQALTKSYPTITFGAADSSLTYPANGVPLPDMKLFGMKKFIKRLRIDSPPDGYKYAYDKAHSTIRIFQCAASAAPMVELATNAPVLVTNLDLEVLGA
jgi:hypothetical protein